MTSITNRTPLNKIVIIRNCTGLSITQKSILYSIASRLGKNNFCFPGLTTLMKDSGINHRTSLIKNLAILETLKIIWIIKEPGKSNKYGINFDLLVRVAHQCSALGALDQCATRTRVVRVAHPKVNINKKLKENKEEPLLIEIDKAKEAREQIRKTCRIKRST